jgi:7-cyano-7-deazaguanine synthase
MTQIEPAIEETSALVLFSGGQDSTTCLAWALSRFAHVETIGFDYGQRHRVELDCRSALRQGLASIFPQWINRLGADHLIEVDALGRMSQTALTRETEIEFSSNGLPNTFVPGRNLLFLTFAAALAYRRGISDLVGGMCETDFSGYPDCRAQTIQAMAQALSLGMEKSFVIHTPLMWLDKAQTWRLAHDLGGAALIDLVRVQTHSCYLGDRHHSFDWGFGCGTCPACNLRAVGWRKFTEEISTSPGL